jgi:hypothetical protein
MKRKGRLILAASVGMVLSAFFMTPPLAQTQDRAASDHIPRTADRKPDFNGVWQVLNTAAWDIQDHGPALGVPPGEGIVDGNELPYQPWAVERKKENFANRATADLAEVNCYMPGVPRATYMPFPFEIVQDSRVIAIRYEFAHTLRIVPLDGRSRDHLEGWPDFWMGDSRGRWEGDTLVVDVRKIDERTWFDQTGNFHSDALHVVERYSPIDRDHIQYEATIDDPKVFTRPWKMSMPLYRRIDKDVRVLEYNCAWFLQEQKYKDAKPH